VAAIVVAVRVSGREVEQGDIAGKRGKITEALSAVTRPLERSFQDVATG